MPHARTDYKLALNFISVDFMLYSENHFSQKENKELWVLKVRRKFPWQSCGVSYCRKVFGAKASHNQAYQTLQHTRPGLSTPRQFNILNNYWICHQTKPCDTKRCVNLWLLPLNYVWLDVLFMKRKWKRKKTSANKKNKKRASIKTMGCK